MNPAIKNITKYFTKTPKTLFLVDALGAVATAFSLFVVLRNYYTCFGMPEYILTYLSIIAISFCMYSTACFFLLKDNWTPFLRAISIANLIYCMLTMALLYIYFQELTTLGLAYFTIEILIILALVYVEWSVASAVRKLN
jgi:hypothetical protein